MSTPRSLALPAGVTAVTASTSRGDFACHDAPAVGTERGHVLLVPGFTGSKEDFTPVLGLLSAQGWHATSYDQRGQYQTPGADDADFSLAGFAADALAVRAATSTTSSSHLVGHSFGGLVAQTALVAEPVAWLSCTLMCTGPAGFSTDAKVKPLRAFIDAVPRSGLDGVFTVQQSRRDPVAPEILDFLHRRFTANSPVSLVDIAARLIDAPDRLDEVAATGTPIAVVRGADDAEWSPQVQDEMAARLGLTVTVIPDAAHSPAVENPTATAAALAAFFAAP